MFRKLLLGRDGFVRRLDDDLRIRDSPSNDVHRYTRRPDRQLRPRRGNFT